MTKLENGVVLTDAELDKLMRRKRRRTSNRVLVILALFLLAFIACMITTFWVKGSVPDTLIQYTLGAGGVETVVLAAIKVSKVLAGKNDTAGDGGKE